MAPGRRVLRGDQQGRRHLLKLNGGGKIVERLESKNDAGRSYSYSILESPLPVARYRATLHAEDQPGARSCRVDWSGEFEPSGAPESEAVKVVRGIYDSGLQSLSKMFGG